MITPKNYLNPIETMTTEEKLAYLANVKQWTEEAYPALEATVDAWTEAEVQKLDTGVVLASALTRAHRILSTIYQHPILRRLNRVRDVLMEIQRQYGSVNYQAAVDIAGEKPVKERAMYKGEGAVDTSKETSLFEAARRQAEAAEKAGALPEVSARRPSSFATYRHLLPAALQKRGDDIKEKYIDLAEARGVLERIADREDVSADVKAHWATVCTKTQDEIIAFWDEVDAAYQKVVNGGKPAGEPVGETSDTAAEEPVGETTGTVTEEPTKPKKATRKKATTKKAKADKNPQDA